MRIILLLIPLFFSLINTMAQGNDGQYYIKVASFRALPQDMDARIQAPVEDQNGEKCALLKVATTVKGLRFESPALGITKQSDMQSLGEVWVYVPAGSKSISIFHGMCKPIRNYTYPTKMESAAVYEMMLESNLPKEYLFEVDSNDDIIYNDNVFRTVNFTVQPAKAQIVILKMPQQTDENGKLSVQVPLGKIHYKVSAENYHDYEGVFDMKESDNNLPVNVELKKHTGYVNVTTTPVGATVFVDGNEIGHTPFAKPLETTVGNHEVKLVLANHKTETREVAVRKDATAQVDVVLSNSAVISIESTPSGARLYINSSNVGVTPYKEDMKSADYDIRLEKKGYRTLTKQVHLDSSLPEQKFSLARQYQEKNQYYLQLMGQVGGYTSVGGAIGAFVSNINIEGTFLNGLSSETVYWNNVTENARPVEEKLSSMHVGGKIGYGIVSGTRLRITPQAGIGCMMLKGDGVTESNAVNASLGVRADYAVANHVSLVLAPEYSFAVTESETHKKLTSVSSAVKGWTSGFNVRLGVCFYL